MLKRLLNRPEAQTDETLRDVCQAWGAHVFAKVRVADVLRIEHSGISPRQFRFALQSHFDFTVTDSDKQPLFVVEFDGPGHSRPIQVRRDELKDQLCELFHLPLLRINSRYLETYRTMNLLSWFVEAWFGARAFADAQESGAIPYDEPFDPMWFISIPGRKGWFPMQLGYEIRQKIRRLCNSGKCRDPSPSYFCGADARENYRIISYLRLNDETGVYATSGMRCQQFDISPGEVLDELVLFDLWSRIEEVLQGRGRPLPTEDLYRAVREFQSKYEMRSTGFCSRIGEGLLGPEPAA